MSFAEPFDAVVLAGGAARRMGGADKPGLDVGGISLLERVAAAVSEARTTIVVGPERPTPAARYVREDPPGSGPLPALRAGLAEVAAPWFALLAGDLPFVAPEHVADLRRTAEGCSGAVLLDAEGHPQWLLGVWDTAAVRAALDGHTGSSLRGLLGPLDPAMLALDSEDDPTAFDCDTPTELARARARIALQSVKSAKGTVSRRNPRAPRNSER